VLETASGTALASFPLADAARAARRRKVDDSMNSLVYKLPLVIAALVPSIAAADELGFVTMDRQARGTAVGVQVGYHELADDELDQLTATRLEIYGHHQLAGKPFGLYGQLAMSRIFIDDADDASGMGNLELGGYWMIARPGMDLALRAGVSLPTADDDLEGFLSNALTMTERLVDFANMVPDTTLLRLSASPILQRGAMFFRADLGLDIPIEDDVIEDVLFHANVGVGLRAGDVALTGELVTVGNLTSDDGDLDERTISTAAISARANLGKVDPYASVIVPLDEELRGEVYVLAIGAQIELE
jgi:hypothetical protein